MRVRLALGASFFFLPWAAEIFAEIRTRANAIYYLRRADMGFYPSRRSVGMGAVVVGFDDPKVDS